MQEQWHYKDENSGSRLGPVGEDDVARLIADGRIGRSTLVWTPAMSDWAPASTTTLAQFFRDTPPPLPAGPVDRWAIYALALFPLWGTAIQMAVGSAVAGSLQTTTPDLVQQPGWILFFVAGNAILGFLDGRNLKKAGIDVVGATVFAALMVPVYILVSCRGVQEHRPGRALRAYLPAVLWLVSIALIILPVFDMLRGDY